MPPAQVIDFPRVISIAFFAEKGDNGSMTKQYHFLDGRRDKFGSYHVLWHTGNYSYEIECRTTGKKLRLQDTTFEQAKRAFQHLLASY